MKALPLQTATIEISFRSQTDLKEVLKAVTNELTLKLRDVQGSACGHQFTIRKGKEEVKIQELDGKICVVIQSKMNRP